MLPTDESILEEELQALIGRYFRHIVGLAGIYEHIDINGKQSPKKPFYYSATILEVADCWYLVTAGHILEKLDVATTRGDMRLVAIHIDDTYAPSGCYKDPIRNFTYQDTRRFYLNKEGGLDFGMIQLRQNYRDLLAANGVLPLVAKHWNPSQVVSCNAFLMCGFPEDCINASVEIGENHYTAEVKATPNVVWVERYEVPIKETRFVGQVGNQKQIGSIVGMSGGPIICCRDTDTDDYDDYYVAGIQSSWDSKKRLTFACPIPSILSAADDFLTAK